MNGERDALLSAHAARVLAGTGLGVERARRVAEGQESSDVPVGRVLRDGFESEDKL